MPKKFKIIIITIIILSFVVGGIWYWNKNINQAKKEKEKTAFITGFTLLDDEKNLDWDRTSAKFSQEARAQFEKKVSDIKNNLAKAEDKGTRLANYNDLAIYQHYLGNYKESYDAYIESLKLEDRNRVTWQNFADVLLAVKAYKSAEAAYKKAVDLNKYIPESYVKLANYYQVLGDDIKVEQTYQSAIETIRQSLENDALVLDSYADWLVSKQRHDEAIKILRELQAEQPDNKEAIEREIEKLNKL